MKEMINIKNILIAGILILGMLLFRQCGLNSDLKFSNAVFQQNQIALNDTIRIVKNKSNEDVFMKNTLIAEKKDLKDLNKSLYDEVNNLKGKVLYISKITASVKTDTIFIENQVDISNSGINRLSWEYYKAYNENNNRSIKGFSEFLVDTNFAIIDKGTTISEDIMNISITTGLDELDGSYQIFVKTDYPGISFTNIDGAILDKKRFMKQTQPSWIFGPSVYVGLGIDPLNNTAGPQIGIGLSATFNLNKVFNNIFNK